MAIVYQSPEGEPNTFDRLYSVPEREQDDFTRYLCEEAEYIAARRLADGSYAGLRRLFTTVAITMECDRTGHRRRYCYESVHDAIEAFKALGSAGDIPTGWISRRPRQPGDAGYD